MSILDNLSQRGFLCWRENNTPVPIRRGKVVIGFRKFDPNRIGIPDIMLVFHGQLIGIEAKRAGEKQKPEQIHWQQRLNAAGARYLVAYSWEDVAAFLNIP